MSTDIQQEEQKQELIAEKALARSECDAGIEKRNIKFFLYGFIGLLALAAVAVGVFGAYRAYAKGATDSFTLAVAKVLRLPIMKVDGTAIHYSDYAEDMNAIRLMRDYDKANNGPGANFTEEQMSDQVLWRLANNIWLSKTATIYNVTADQKQIDDIKARLLTQFKDNATLESELQKRYGWNLETYEKKVMRPAVLQMGIDVAVQADKSLRDGVVNKANEVLNQIKGGADFAALAKQYGQDGTAQNGGDLGWFGKGEMVPQFETAAFALKKGEIANALVETQYGYHVIKLEDVKKEKPAGGKGKEVEKIRARHILFRFPNVNSYMDGLARKADVQLYARLHNPFDELKKS